MTAQKLITILLIVAALATLGGIWQFSNSRGIRARGRRRADQIASGSAKRQNDVRELSRSERRLYKEAQRMLKQKRVQPAARILEQLNMPREAISALEDHGYIDEAAKILLRMQRPNRAGVVYARHGMWEKAGHCFQLAEMWLEVARCALQVGDAAKAAANFERVGRFEEAAKCFEDTGEYVKAAKLLRAGNLREAALATYSRAASQENMVASVAAAMSEQEVDELLEVVVGGRNDAGLIALLAARGRLPEGILAMLAKGQVSAAIQLFRRASADIGPILMAEISYHDRSAGALAELFKITAYHQYAGMVYERMGSFEQAGVAFEADGDFERAQYCYERAGNDAKARALSSKAKLAPKKKQTSNSAFALANIAPTEAVPEGSHGAGGDAQEESTRVLPAAAAAAPVAPPRAQYPVPASSAPAPARIPPSAGAFQLGGADADDEDEAAVALPPPPVVAPAPAPTAGLAATGGPRWSDLEAGAEDDGDEDDANQASADEEHDAESQSSAAAAHAAPEAITDPHFPAFDQARFLADLDSDQRKKLWRIGMSLDYSAGSTILTYQDEPRGLYIILSGEVNLCRQTKGEEKVVDTIRPGDSFGELWLLADQPTAVRFVAATPTRLRVVGREAFHDLLDHDGSIARKIYKTFTLRLLKRLLHGRSGGSDNLRQAS